MHVQLGRHLSLPPGTGNAAIAPEAMAVRNILSTTVSITSGHTVVLGSTQPSGVPGALILAVRPELRESP
jgi:hypothetical protein